MHDFTAIIAITLLAVVSPGPDFAMVTRNSYAFGVRSGLISALGVACGVQVHVFYTVFGIAVFIVNSPFLFFIMKILGALYLVYLGVKSFLNKDILKLNNSAETVPTNFESFRVGFLTNALNPKTMLFVVATYTQLIRPESPLLINFYYGLFISFAHLIWFSIVALFFSKPNIRSRLLEKQLVLDKIIGVALVLLGMSLFFIKM